jgi:uncharacterized protein YjaG (DUF416 family)
MRRLQFDSWKPGNSNQQSIILMPTFNSELIRILERAEKWRKVAFMSRCCTRMIPNYKLFSLESNFGDVCVLRTGLLQIVDWIKTDIVHPTVVELIRMCDSLAPNTEEFESAYTSAALNAVNSVAITLEALRPDSAPNVGQVAELSFDTVEMFVRIEQNFGDYDIGVYQHEFVKREMERQRNDIFEICGSHFNRRQFESGESVGSVVSTVR